MKTETRPCPCWHLTYSREAGQYRNVTAPDCPHCGGTGYAQFVAFDNPRNVRRLPAVTA